MDKVLHLRKEIVILQQLIAFDKYADDQRSLNKNQAKLDKAKQKLAELLDRERKRHGA